jgi:hypothetical protein
MKIKWNEPRAWKEDPGLFPNDLVLLLVQIVKGKNCLIDVESGDTFVTMGNWCPKIKNSDGTVEKGHWEYVGWNWDQDEFVSTEGDKVIGWSPLPEPRK